MTLNKRSISVILISMTIGIVAGYLSLILTGHLFTSVTIVRLVGSIVSMVTTVMVFTFLRVMFEEE